MEILRGGELAGVGEYVIMELVEGETLCELIGRQAPLTSRLALQVGEDILCALSAIHHRGFVHRDVKPGNVLLRGHPEVSPGLAVKLCDFGLARQLDLGNDGIGSAGRRSRPPPTVKTVAGTPEYLSPEQAAGQPVDGQADLYALGVVMFEMLAGQLPFRAATCSGLLRLHQLARPPRLQSLVEVPLELEEFVDSLLAKDPHHRPRGVDAALEAIHRLRDARPGLERYVPQPTPSLREEGFSEPPVVRDCRPTRALA